MKLRITFLLLCSFISLSFTNCVNISSNVIKSLTLYSYSPNHRGILNREDAMTGTFESKEIYNEKGELIESYNFLGEKTLISLDKNGKIAKSTQYDENGIEQAYTTTTLDKNGNITEYKTFDPSNTVVSIQTEEYDKNGNLITMIVKNLSSDMVWKTSYVYNNKKQLTKETEYDQDSKIKEVRTNKYDNKGNVFETELSKQDGEYIKFVYEYDKLNNVQIEKWYDINKNLKQKTSFKYVYDKNGNWITRHRFSNDELNYIWEREILYY